MAESRTPSSLFARIASIAGASAATLALAASGCGKEPNTSIRSFLHFSHTFPEAPRALDLSTGLNIAPASTGAAIAVRAADLLALDRDNGTLVRLDIASLAVLETVSVGMRPEQLVIAPSGDIWVSLRGSGEVVHFNSNLELIERHKLGVDVHGLALAPDGLHVHATLPLEGQVVTLAAITDGSGDFREAGRIHVGDMPRGLAFAPPGNTSEQGALIIALQGGEAVRIPVEIKGLPTSAALVAVTLRDANPSEFMLTDGNMFAVRTRSIQPTRALAVAINPETGAAHVAHALAAPGEPEFLANENRELNADSERNSASRDDDGYGSSGGIAARNFAVPVRPVETTVTTIAQGATTASPIEASLAIRDDRTGEPMTHLVDQPSDIRHHPLLSLLFVAGYGTDNVIVFSTAEGDPARSPVAVIEVGSAPRGIAFSGDGKTAFVLNDFDFSVSTIDLTPLFDLKSIPARIVVADPIDDESGMTVSVSQLPEMEGNGDIAGSTAIVGDPTPDSLRVRPLRLAATQSVVFAKDPWPSDLRAGARIFTHTRNDSISHAGQFACATCHFEGQEDKVTWVTPDGVRQTIALAGRLNGTGPFNWNGSEDELQSNMNKTISRMGGVGLESDELRQLEVFLLQGLPAVPNPFLAPDGQLTAEQERGKALFNDPEVGCASCHRPDNNFVDGFRHDVGSANTFEMQRWEREVLLNPDVPKPGNLNTPSLKDLFYTGPYLHDGSAPDLMAVIERTRDRMGKTSHLSSEDLEALIAYLKTL